MALTDLITTLDQTLFAFCNSTHALLQDCSHVYKEPGGKLDLDLNIGIFREASTMFDIADGLRTDVAESILSYTEAPAPKTPVFVAPKTIPSFDSYFELAKATVLTDNRERTLAERVARLEREIL